MPFTRMRRAIKSFMYAIHRPHHHKVFESVSWCIRVLATPSIQTETHKKHQILNTTQRDIVNTMNLWIFILIRSRHRSGEFDVKISIRTNGQTLTHLQSIIIMYNCWKPDPPKRNYVYISIRSACSGCYDFGLRVLFCDLSPSWNGPRPRIDIYQCFCRLFVVCTLYVAKIINHKLFNSIKYGVAHTRCFY